MRHIYGALLVPTLVLFIMIGGSAAPAFFAAANPADESVVVNGYTGDRTTTHWGITEPYLDVARGYLEDPNRFGPGGTVGRSITFGDGVAGGLTTADLDGVDIFVAGLTSIPPAELDLLEQFVLDGGALLSFGDGSLGAHPAFDIPRIASATVTAGPAIATVTDTAHPIVDGPFGAVTSYEQWITYTGYDGGGPHGTVLATNDIGAAAVTIPPGELGAGAGPVVHFGDIDTFAKTTPTLTPGSGGHDSAVRHAALISNTFAWLMNATPGVDAGVDATTPEGSAVALDGTVVDGSPPTQWTASPGAGVDPSATCTFGDPAAVDTTVTCDDDGMWTLTLTADDGVDPKADTATLTVTNEAPDVTVTAPAVGAIASVGAAVQAAALVSDPGVNDAVSCEIAWGDGSTTPACQGSHAYASPGSYTVTVTALDDDGADASGSVALTVVTDDIAPVSTAETTPSSPGGANGWFTDPVTVDLTATDAGSGVQDITYSIDGGAPVTVAGAAAAIVLLDDGEHALTFGATDNAGNVESPSGLGVKLDQTAPADVVFTGGPDAGHQYPFGAVPAAATCGATDATSGLASCVVSGYSTQVGSHVLTATATDGAGNTATSLRSYSVSGWTTAGFKAPVNMSSTNETIYNTVKGGATVPLKFEVFAGTSEVTSVTTIGATLAATPVPCEGGLADAIEVTATGGTRLIYDESAGHFIFNWKTPAKRGCYELTLTVADGSAISAHFRLR